MTEQVSVNIVNDCWNQTGTWRTGNEVCSKLDSAIHCQNCDIYKQAGLNLLDRPLPDHYKKNNALAFSVKKEGSNTQEKSLLVFRYSTEWYAITTSILDEVCSCQPVHKLPHNPSQFIEGLVNIRGVIEICLSLGNLLAYKSARSDSITTHAKLIVIQLDIGRFAILADEISGIFKIDTEKVLLPPTSVTINDQSLISGMIEQNDHQVGIFSVSRLEKKLAAL